MPMATEHVCVECGADLSGSYYNRRYCSVRCKQRWRKAQGFRQGKTHVPVTDHACRICGKVFPIRADQGNKWLCSDVCRRASTAKSIREFYKRDPKRVELYRARTKAKRLPDGNLIRFYRVNPHAPRSCEVCGECRVVDIAHKPGHYRNGARRRMVSDMWPDKVWILCPTCHALVDRMHYPPSDLKLTV